MSIGEVKKQKGFDYVTHIRDPQTGLIIKDNSYRRVNRDGKIMLERPIDSGYWYNEGGDLIKSPDKEKVKQHGYKKIDE